MQRVTGQKDPIIIQLRELQAEDGRRLHRRFFAEGEELVARAFDFGGYVDCIILTERFAASPDSRAIAERAVAGGVTAYVATEGLLSKILDAKPTPECLAIVERKVSPLKDIFGDNRTLIQMVEHGENADNLGMLLRTTDASGVDGVILAADTVDAFGRRVVRGSRGAVFTVPICIAQESCKVINEARTNGFQVIATSANTERFHTSVDFARPTMIVVGNEHVGISETVREMADAVVRIPMKGRINSLNIAVAASVVMYEAVRQRS